MSIQLSVSSPPPPTSSGMFAANSPARIARSAQLERPAPGQPPLRSTSSSCGTSSRSTNARVVSTTARCSADSSKSTGAHFSGDPAGGVLGRRHQQRLDAGAQLVGERAGPAGRLSTCTASTSSVARSRPSHHISCHSHSSLPVTPMTDGRTSSRAPGGTWSR